MRVALPDERIANWWSWSPPWSLCTVRFPIVRSVTSGPTFTTAAPQSSGWLARQFLRSSAKTMRVLSRSSPTIETWLRVT